MSWKNWGDHPIVVSIGVAAALAGLISVGYSIGSSPNSQKESITPSSVQTTNGNNNTNINSSGGNVNIDNSNKIEINKKTETPRFSEEIINCKKENKFAEFINNNEGKVVYIDAYYAVNSSDEDSIFTDDIDIDDSTKETTGRFIIANSCDSKEVRQGLYAHRFSGGYSYMMKMHNNSDSLYTFNTGAYHLKGYWSVKRHPGSPQGIIHTTLSAIDAKDIRH
jgi:hypothetical protein